MHVTRAQLVAQPCCSICYAVAAVSLCFGVQKLAAVYVLLDNRSCALRGHAHTHKKLHSLCVLATIDAAFCWYGIGNLALSYVWMCSYSNIAQTYCQHKHAHKSHILYCGRCLYNMVLLVEGTTFGFCCGRLAFNEWIVWDWDAWCVLCFDCHKILRRTSFTNNIHKQSELIITEGF